MPQEREYTADFQAPDFIRRATSQTLELPVRWGGALVAPTSGTVSILDENGSAVVDEAAVVVASSIATYSLSAATVPATLAYSSRWRERWTLLMSDTSEVHVFERPAALVRSRVYPVISVEDINGRHTDLDRVLSDAVVQTRITAAWDDVMKALMRQGRKPYRLLDASDLRDVHRARVFHLCFLDMWSSAASGKFKGLADYYANEWSKAWTELVIDYDMDDDGVTDEGEEKRSGPAVLFTGSVGAWEGY